MKLRWRLALGGALMVTTLVALAAQERVDQDVFWKIRQEETNNSQILRTLHVLTDVYGPRLTGSPNLKGAGEWAVQQMQTWGLKNGRLEPWDFGRSGWLNERLAAHIVSPVKDPLIVEALSWTPGTNGVVRGTAIQLTLPQRPTGADLTAYFARIRESVKGKMVLVGPPRQLTLNFNPPAMRRDDSEIVTQLNAPPNPGRVGGPPAAPPVPVPGRPPQPALLTANQIEEQLMPFLASSGALVRINDAGRDGGQIRAFNNRLYDVAKAPPTVVMRNEDYGRISRLLADGRAVELEFDIVNHVYPEGRTSYNVVAEIPGTDKADEVVMLGGHLDSWHAATGATDNAIGCAVMMEAARILTAIGAKPRRTIRVALWSGEEQGLLGSQAYVKEHFGTFEQQKADYEKFAGYFNIDQGTGRARGFTVFGPPEAATVLKGAVASFKDLGVLGANTTRNRARGGSDHTSFNEAGLPGILVMQDPIQYDAQTWHTNLDTYERIVEEDVKKSAIAIAAAVYHLSMRDERLPLFKKDEMPRRPPPAPPAVQPQSAAAPASAQTEVSLLAPNPFRRTLDKVTGGFEPKTGYKLNVTLGRGVGTRQQVARGEMFDVSILLPPYPEALASGNIDPKSATMLAKLVLAVGVKKGAARPDVSSVEALKRTLLAAKTIAYVDPNIGSDGAATRDALQKLGVLDQINSKAKIAGTASASAELVGKDEAEICIFYRNEMGVNPNVDVVGTLPAEISPPTDIVAFISTHARDAKAAKALVEYLSSPESEAVYAKDGLVPRP